MAAPSSDLGLSVLRSVLEEHLSLELAPKVLFAALSRLPAGQDLPRSEAALVRFIVGPLSQVLGERLGHDAATDVLDALNRALSTAADSLPPAQGDAAQRASAPYEIEVEVDSSFGIDPQDPYGEARDTAEILTSAALGEALRLMIIARTTRLARWLRAAFGDERVATSVSNNLRDSSERLVSFAPSIVIIDGEDLADVSLTDLTRVVAAAAASTLVIVWASDQPGGSAVQKSFDREDVVCAPVPRSAGFEPMLDYVRARIG